MAITDKTRKILWATSGNKCAYCSKQLVKIQFDVQTICGEECHIVSSKPNGPRHRNMDNYDIADNLILLCQEHHKMIDENPDKFPENELHKLKEQHELKLKKEYDKDKQLLLYPISNAKDLVRLLSNAEQYATDYPNDTGDIKLFEEFFEIVNNFDVLDDYSEFEKIRIIEKSFNRILENRYIVVGANKEKYGKFNLNTAFIVILTEKQFLENKINDLGDTNE